MSVMQSITMLVLAKSYKQGGRCIAGRQVEFKSKNQIVLGEWIRPVGSEDSRCNPIYEDVYTYTDGTEVQLLDIVEVPLTGHCPILGQPENTVIDCSRRWIKRSSFDPACIKTITDSPESVWLDKNALPDRVTSGFTQQGLVSQSLYLIKPEQIVLTLSHDSYQGRPKKRITASFCYQGVTYSGISITCPAVRKMLKNRYPELGKKPVDLRLFKGDSYMFCMSLGPRFGRDNQHYKFVASVFDYDGYLQRTFAA